MLFRSRIVGERERERERKRGMLIIKNNMTRIASHGYGWSTVQDLKSYSSTSILFEAY